MDLTISRVFKFFIALLFIAAIGWLLFALHQTITILIIALLIAYILNPVAGHLEYRGMSRLQATATIFLALSLLLILLGVYLIPLLIKEIVHIQHGITSGAGSVYFERINALINDAIPMVNAEPIDVQAYINQGLKQFSESFFSIVGSVVSLVTTLVIIPFAVFFLLKDGRHIKKSLVGLIPNRYFEMSLNIIYKIDLQLGGYLRGQFFDALIVGALSIIALWILNVRYNVLIGMFAGLANLIPYVGPLVGALTAMVVVLLNGGATETILLVAAAFAVIQLMDNVLIQPLVVAKSVNLHPLIVIFAVIIGGQFFGILGMLLAVPATGILKVLFGEVYNAFRKYRLV